VLPNQELQTDTTRCHAPCILKGRALCRAADLADNDESHLIGSEVAPCGAQVPANELNH
jgi:hypothetical protein